MSGSLNSIYDTVSFALYLHSKALMSLQEQASTGARVNRASDSPSDAYRILGLNSQERSLTSYIDNLTEVESTLEITSTIVQQMVSELAETRTQLTQVTSGLETETGRTVIAESVNDALEQLVSLANTKHSNQYIFGGSDTTSAPYVVERTDGEITQVTYQGSSDVRNVEVASGLRSSALYVGQDIFASNSREEPVFTGDTGATAGSGTSSVCGDVWLTVTQDGSNYKLSIDDGASYVTVPEGGDSNTAVTDLRTGRVLYVDTTGLTGTGVELVRVPGTYDVFSTLISIRDMLNNDRGLSDSQLSELQNSCISAVEEVRNLLVQAGVSVGSRIGFLDTLKGNLEDMQLNTQDEATQLSEADIAQVAVDISRREILYEMSLSVAGKLMSMSLLDYIE